MSQASNYDPQDLKLPETHCALCMQMYDKPTVLMCGHSWCAGCVQLLVVNKNELSSISCPQCRTITNVQINSLPVNHGMIELINLVHRMQRAMEATDLYHPNYLNDVGDCHQDDRHRNDHLQTDRHQKERDQNRLLLNDRHQSDRDQNELHQNDRHQRNRHHSDFDQNIDMMYRVEEQQLGLPMGMVKPELDPLFFNQHHQFTSMMSPPSIYAANNCAQLPALDHKPMVTVAEKLVIRKMVGNQLSNKVTIDMPLHHAVAQLIYKIVKIPAIRFHIKKMKLVWNGLTLNKLKYKKLVDLGVKRGDTLEVWS